MYCLFLLRLKKGTQMFSTKEFPHALVYRIGSVFIFCLFISVMVMVCVVSMNRQSGVTGIDVSRLKERAQPLAQEEGVSEQEVSRAAQ